MQWSERRSSMTFGHVVYAASSPSSEDDAGWEALEGQRYTGSKDPADHPHSSVRTAWMRRKRWALAACIGLILLLLAPVVVVRIVHIVLDVIDVSPFPSVRKSDMCRFFLMSYHGQAHVSGHGSPPCLLAFHSTVTPACNHCVHISSCNCDANNVTMCRHDCSRCGVQNIRVTVKQLLVCCFQFFFKVLSSRSSPDTHNLPMQAVRSTQIQIVAYILAQWSI